ncbi:DUF3226 domain-containing protein [uncultured Stenotrophomonas sp.]|uniref:DUF3226 domain-containing protein n=1 Tax=uncultured Stenotrophomonas sp. TaxID=165438 RepID=UPI0026003A37|nr:DUF3226 domain-containing protein [uncultured Stenotrophomonas sp.]
MVDERIVLVEGNDDLHAIIHVLSKRGAFVEGEIKFVDSKGWDNLIASIPVRLKSSSHRVIGIIADSDNVIEQRWSDICEKLEPEGFGPFPEMPPDGGFVARGDDNRLVAVWLMPNNRDNGALEDFLLSLIVPSDPVLGKATNVVDGLDATEKRFGPTGIKKAVVHTYLAWQESPGRPLGLAVNCNYFDARAANALDFESWYRQLTV